MLPLIHIYNLSFKTGIVPDLLKVAKVIPILQKRGKTSPRQLSTHFTIKYFR